MPIAFPQLSKSRSKQRRRHRSAIATEALEQRQLLTAQLVFGSWYVAGTNGADEISVSQSEGDASTLVATLNGKVVGTEAAADVNRIVMFGRDGDDTLTVSQEIGVDSRLYGQRGNDVIAGGSGNDLIAGGSGHDSLSGFAGIDRIFGGSGRDEIFGGEGDDYLYGNNGADWVSGDAGDDLVVGGFGRDMLLGGEGEDDVRGDLADRISDAQVENLNNLMGELNRIVGESEVTAEHVRTLLVAIRNMVEDTEVPSEEARQFLRTFEDSLEDGSISREELEQLLADGRALVEGIEVPPERVEAVLDAINAIADASNYDEADFHKLVGHVRAIRLEFQRNWFTDEQNASLDKLRNTLLEFANDSEVTKEDVEAVFTSVRTMLDGATFPEKEVGAFLNTLKNALKDGRISGFELIVLGIRGRAVLRAANISEDEAKAVVDSLVKVVVSSNISRDDLRRLGNDLKDVASAFFS